MWDILFPKSCVGCGKRGSYICETCIAKAAKASPQCPVCKKFSFRGKTHGSCSTKYDLDGLIALWKYEGVIRAGIHALKYKYVDSLAEELVIYAFDLLQPYNDQLKRSIFVPIPTHISRERFRGFNQTDLIARELTKQFKGSTISCLLSQGLDKKSQVGSSKKERARNIIGKYAVNNTGLLDSEANYILIDDVWTTGSTMREATKTLKKAGIKNVCGFVLARG